MRKIVKGEEVVILAEDGYGGFQSISTERLTMKMEDLFSEEVILEMIANGLPPGIRKMTLIAVIKSDLADKLGWGRHNQTLKDEGLW